jgi:serralysin
MQLVEGSKAFNYTRTGQIQKVLCRGSTAHVFPYKSSTMHNAFRALYCFTFVVAVTSNAVAQQPPDIARWDGGTANTQSQGFSKGDPLKLTWGFAALGTSINDSAFNGGFANAPNNLQTRLNAIYGNQATWQPIFQSSFDRWSAISGLTFQLETADDGADYIVNGNSVLLGSLGVRADIRIGGKALDGNGGVLAYNYFPEVGDMVIDTNDNFMENTSSNSSTLRYVLAHELGHALGIAHVESADRAFLMEPFLQGGFVGPAYHDILTVQSGYGDALEKSNDGLGNDIAANATSLGTIVLGGNVSIGNDARNFSTNANTTDFISIDNSSDTDFFSFNVNSAGSLNISLDALGFTYSAGPQSGTQVNFNTRQRSDLRFSLFGPDGSTLLAAVNSFGLGVSESLTGFNLSSAGTYFVRVEGTANGDASTLDTQFYGLGLGFITAVPEPSSLALVALIGTGALGWRGKKRRGKPA